MRRILWAARKDILQRVALVVVLFVIAFGGAWLGVRDSPNVLGVLVTVLGAVTLMWLLDPALQLLLNSESEREEEMTDGNVA
jgi:preprotein translocase subunit SecE